LEFGVVFFTSLSLAQHPRPARRTTPGRHHGTMLIQRERASCTVNQRGELGCTKEPRMAWEPTWEPCSSDWFKTQVQIQACLRRQKGSLIKSQNRDTLVPTFWGETMSLRFREQCGSTVLCESVLKCELEIQPSCKVNVESRSAGTW
jgi:hypothetical protein